MFDITSNFQYGVYHPNYSDKVNGFQTMAMQEQQDVDKVIAAAENLIKAGYNPYLAGNETKMFQEAGVDRADLSNFNLKRIARKVREIWESRNNGF